MHSQYPVWVFFFVHKLIVLLWSLNYFYSINLKKYLCKNFLYYYIQTWKWILCRNKSIFEHNVVVMWVTLLEVSGLAELTRQHQWGSAGSRWTRWPSWLPVTVRQKPSKPFFCPALVCVTTASIHQNPFSAEMNCSGSAYCIACSCQGQTCCHKSVCS